jgi:rRNA maturation RNase YbeY
VNSALILRNRQRALAVDLRRLRAVATALIEDWLGLESFDLGVYLVSVSEMARLNETYLRHQGSTDVITFDYTASAPTFPEPETGRAGLPPSRGLPGLAQPGSPGGSPYQVHGLKVRSPSEEAPRNVQLQGEIFICPAEAKVQARRFRTTWTSELTRYLVHGLLHLQGYDDLRAADRRRMKRREGRLLRQLSRQFDLRELAR